MLCVIAETTAGLFAPIHTSRGHLECKPAQRRREVIFDRTAPIAHF